MEFAGCTTVAVLITTITQDCAFLAVASGWAADIPGSVLLLGPALLGAWLYTTRRRS